MPVLANQSFIHGIGFLSQLNVFSLESMVIDREIMKTVDRLVEGIVVDEDHLAYSVMEEEAETFAFMSNDHTYEHFRTEHFIPELTDRRMLQNWKEDADANNIRRRAKRMIATALNNYNYDGKDRFSEKIDAIINGFMKKLN
jgi:trimethylamine--corrinoid protein Co-methyltransferase